MSKFIPYTQDEKDRASQTDLVDLLERNGEKLKKEGKNYVWGSGSEKVTIRGNVWFHQYERVGGEAVDFVKKFYNKTYREAMDYLLGKRDDGELIRAEPKPHKEKKPFEMPPRNSNMRRVYGYLLNGRGIDRDVLNAFVHKGLIYESADYHNAVFVGLDNTGKPVHVHKRGTVSHNGFKGNVESSIPEYSFHWIGTSDKVFFMEAPIDMLSYISLHKQGWEQHNYAAGCGVSDLVLFQMIKDHPHIKTAVLCVDNDEAGHKAINRIRPKLEEIGIACETDLSVLKDWNMDLTATEEPVETSGITQSM